LIETEAAFPNDAIFESPAFVATYLKIQVSVIHTATHHAAECSAELPFVEAGWLEHPGHQ